MDELDNASVDQLIATEREFKKQDSGRIAQMEWPKQESLDSLSVDQLKDVALKFRQHDEERLSPFREQAARGEGAYTVGEGPGAFIGRSFVSPIRSIAMNSAYGIAKGRMSRGEAEDSDLRAIAAYEHEQGIDQKQPEWAKFAGSAAGAVGSIGPLGLAPGPFFAAQAISGAAAQTGQAPWNPEALLKGGATAAVQLGVLKAIGPLASKVFPEAESALARFGQHALTGSTSLAVADYGTKLVGLSEHGGPIDDLLEGHWGDMARGLIGSAIMTGGLGVVQGLKAGYSRKAAVEKAVEGIHQAAEKVMTQAVQEEVRNPKLKIGDTEVLTPQSKNLNAAEAYAVDKYGENKVLRVGLNGPDGPIGSATLAEEGDTVHVAWVGKTGLAGGEGRGKNLFGAREVFSLATQLAEAMPEAKFLKYTVSEGRIGEGKAKIVDLDAIRRRGRPKDTEGQPTPTADTSQAPTLKAGASGPRPAPSTEATPAPEAPGASKAIPPRPEMSVDEARAFANSARQKGEKAISVTAKREVVMAAADKAWADQFRPTKVIRAEEAPPEGPSVADTSRQTEALKRFLRDSPSPDWVKDNIRTEVEPAIKSGLATKIEELAAEGKLAQQIAFQLGVDRETVRSVRTGLGIPSRQQGEEAQAFEQWKAARDHAKNPAKVAGSETPKPAPEAIPPEIATSDPLAEAYLRKGITKRDQRLHQAAIAGEDSLRSAARKEGLSPEGVRKAIKRVDARLGVEFSSETLREKERLARADLHRGGTEAPGEEGAVKPRPLTKEERQSKKLDDLGDLLIRQAEEGKLTPEILARHKAEAERIAGIQALSEAKEAGLPAEHVEAMAEDIIAEHKESIREWQSLYQDAYAALKEFGVTPQKLHGILTRAAKDPASIKGMDEVAEDLAKKYPGFFRLRTEHASDTLASLLLKGKPKSMTVAEAREQAADRLIALERENVRREASRSGFASEAVEEGIRTGQKDRDAELSAGQAEEGASESGDFAFGANVEFGAPVSESERGPGPGQPTAVGGIPGLPFTEAERQAPTPQLTSLAKEQTAREREALGLEQIPESVRRANKDTWDKALLQIQADPAAPDRLLAELEKSSRPVNRVEAAVLLQRRVAIANELRRARETKGVSLGGGLETLIEQSRRTGELLAMRERFDQAIAKAGSELGGALQFYRQLAAEDFSLGGLLQSAESAKGGPLTEAETAKITELAGKIEDLQKKLDAAEKYAATRSPPKEPEPGLFQKIGGWFKDVFGTKPDRGRGSKVWEFADRLEKEAVAALPKEMLFSGFDPTMIVPMSKYVAAKIIKTGYTFADYSKAIVQKFGDDVKPHLDDIWKKAESEAEQARNATKPVPEARVDLGRAKREAKAEVTRLKEANAPLPQKVFRGMTETLDTARAIMTSMDFSAVLRQAGFVAFGHPLKVARALPEMFRATVSEYSADLARDAINQRANGPLYKRAGLYIADPHGPVSAQEESFAGRWVKKIPGIAASERAYTTVLNRVRADLFDSLASSRSAKARMSDPELKVIADFVNTATGRGSLGGLEKAASTLSRVFFSPRFVVSRFQLLAGAPLYGGTMSTRQAIAKEYARTAIGLGVFYGATALAAQALGAKKDQFSLSFDPRSADFGKIKMGNTRIDPLFGLSQTAVLESRVLSGKTKSSTTGEVSNLREPAFGKQNTFDVMSRFVRSKLAPVPGAAIDIASGSNVVGQPVTPLGKAGELVTPIAIGDIVTAIKDQGVPAGLAGAIASVFGMGVQSYSPKKHTAVPASRR